MGKPQNEPETKPDEPVVGNFIPVYSQEGDLLKRIFMVYPELPCPEGSCSICDKKSTHKSFMKKSRRGRKVKPK